MSTQSVTTRPAEGEADYWAIYRLLIDTVPMLPLGMNWDMRRWEGRRFYDDNPTSNPNWHHGVQMWHAADGTLAGAVIVDESGWTWPQVHPSFRHLEAEMLDWAEAHIAVAAKGDNGRSLHVGAFNGDSERQTLLSSRGYEQMHYGWVIRHLSFGRQALAQPTIADGYTLRVTEPEDNADCAKIADLLNTAFGRTFHNAAEYQWFTRKAPGFRQHLDLVAVAPDGTFASYVGIPYDDVNRRGVFEPVCTHPDHRQRGLGKALMQEGLLRLQAMGAVDVTVETGDAVPANALYSSLGFTHTEKGYYWKKVL